MSLKTVIAVYTVSLLGVIAFAAQGDERENEIKLTPSEKALMAEYKGDVVLPNSLLRAYAQFTIVADAPNKEKLKAFTLPHSVVVETTVRVGKYPEYALGLNIPFVKEKFRKRILNIRKESEHCYLIRTQSSYIRYIKTASKEWKIYQFGDKPIM